MNETVKIIIKNNIFERVENFKYVSVKLNEDNNHQIDLKKNKKC